MVWLDRHRTRGRAPQPAARSSPPRRPPGLSSGRCGGRPFFISRCRSSDVAATPSIPMVAITIALLALALQPAIVPHQRLRAVTARLGASPVLQLDGQGATPVRRALGMKSSSRTIYIDGNNLMMQRKVTKGREKLAERLTGIRGADVVIVFDGRAGTRSTRAARATARKIGCRRALARPLPIESVVTGMPCPVSLPIGALLRYHPVTCSSLLLPPPPITFPSASAGETHSESGHGPRVVITQGGDENGAGMRESADEWIMVSGRPHFAFQRSPRIFLFSAVHRRTSG